jgi:hypothetical protein
MARIRSIKPEFFTSLTIAELPLSARLTFIGLWTYVDDNGVGPADARLIRAAIWPLEEAPDILQRTREDLQRLHAARLITLYEASGRPLVAVNSWSEHQKVSHPRKNRFMRPEEAAELAKYPAPEDLQSPPEDCQSPPETLRPEQGAGSREQGAGSSLRAAGAAEIAPAVDVGTLNGDSERSTIAISTRRGELHLDPDGPMPFDLIVGEWVRRQPERPPGPTIAKQAKAAQRIAAASTAGQVARAFAGMGELFPHSNGEPWDLFDLEKKFAKAMAAAENHPEVRKRRERAEFEAEMAARTH